MRIAVNPPRRNGPPLGILLCALTFAQPSFADCTPPPEIAARLQAQPDADAYTALGTYYGEHQQFTCANDAFSAALKLDPASAKLNYFLGLSLLSSGQVEAAVAALQQSIQLDANALQPRLLLASILRQAGKRSEAEAQWRAILQVQPANPAALDGLANSLTDNGDALLAIELLKPLVPLTASAPSGPPPVSEDLTLDLARAYGVAGMLDQAAAVMQSAVAADPDSFRVANAMTTVLVQQHRYQDAAALMQKFSQQHPDHLEAQIAYLSALVLNNDDTNARPLGVKLLAAAPHDFQVLYLNGIEERKAGDYTAARDHLLEAIKVDPGNTTDEYIVRFNLGSALAHLNDPAGAKEQLEKAIELDSTQAQAHFQLAGVLKTLGDATGAQQQLDLYKQFSAENTARSQADTRSQLAAQKLAAGDYKQAAALYREAVAATPGNAMLQYQLSLALDKAGDTAGERTALEQAVQIDPTFALAQNQLGYLETQSGAAAEAEKHFRQAVTAAPGFIDAWINLAAILAQEGHIPEAQQAVATALQLDAKNQQALALSQKLNEAAHR
jgi:tetratricopeptide (TPR) repeat protein